VAPALGPFAAARAELARWTPADLDDLRLRSPRSEPLAPGTRHLLRAMAPFEAALRAQMGCPVHRFVLSVGQGAPVAPTDVLAATRLARATLLRVLDRGLETQDAAQSWLAVAVFGGDLARRAGLLGATAAAAVWRTWLDATWTLGRPLWAQPAARARLAQSVESLVSSAVAPKTLLRIEALGTAAGVAAAAHLGEGLAGWDGWLAEAQRRDLAALDPEAVALALTAYLHTADRRAEALAAAEDLAAAADGVAGWRAPSGPSRGPLAALQDPTTLRAHLLGYIQALAGLRALALALDGLEEACGAEVSVIRRRGGVTTTLARAGGRIVVRSWLGARALPDRTFPTEGVCAP